MNTVVGFIGPEYLFDGRQVIRAGLKIVHEAQWFTYGVRLLLH